MTDEDGLSQVGMAAALAKNYADDAHGFLPSLASFLEGVMPQKVEVERKPIHLFASKKKVVALTVTLGDLIYTLHATHHDGVLEGKRAKIVRGVTLKTETIAVPAWLEEVAACIAEESKKNESTFYALKEFLKQ